MVAGLAALTILVAFAATLAPVDNTASAQTNPFPSREKVIHVTGIATSPASPDLLVATFGVQTKAETASEALDANSDAMNKVVSGIRTLGIADDELGTSNLNIYPDYEGYYDDRDNYHTKLVGYEVTNMVTVRTPNLDLAADIIDTAIDAGANRLDSIYFTLSPERQISVKDNLLEQAVINARDKAQKALSPLDHHIIGVKSVSISESSAHPGMFTESMGLADLAHSRTLPPISSSDQDVTTTVNVVFLIGTN